MDCSKGRFWLVAIFGGLVALGLGVVVQFSCLRSSRCLLAIFRLEQLLTSASSGWRWRGLLHLIKNHSFIFKGDDGFSFSLLWMAPFLSGGGFCSEALSYVMALSSFGHIRHLRVDQHGDLANIEFWRGLPINTKKLLFELFQPDFLLNETVVICHSEPGAWNPPLFNTNPCPPTGYDEPLYVIGRTMFETDRVTPEHVQRCNKMDEIWIPSEFNRVTFLKSGVLPSKLVKVAQSVDVDFFDPRKTKPLPLPTEGHVFGPGVPKHLRFIPEDWFVFLSIFKWEKRKGWDILIKAYLQEFTAADNAVLYLVTNAYHTDRIYGNEIRKLIESSGICEPQQGWPSLYLSDNHIPQVDLPRLYKAANVFVLPSRGEGWGRPYVEAMSMSLPVIATNWSGMTEYITDANGYLLSLDRLVEVQEGPFKGHLWAEPSLKGLQSLMRHAFSHPSEAKSKGALARKDMVTKYCPRAIAEQVLQQLHRIEREINKRQYN